MTAALAVAARRWPEDADSKTRLLLRLVDAGHRMIDADDARTRQRRVDAVQRTRGQFRGIYGPEHLSGLRDEWPA